MGFLNFLRNHDQILENHVNSACVIECSIQFNSAFHEICYYKLQINKESYIQYIYLLIAVIQFCMYSIRRG